MDLTGASAKVDLTARGTPADANAEFSRLQADFAAKQHGELPKNANTPAEARAWLDHLERDPKWSAKLAANDADAVARWKDLTTKIAGGTHADLALAGLRPDGHINVGTGATLESQIKSVPILRDQGLSDDSIRQILEDQTLAPELVQQAKDLYRLRMRNAAWQKALTDKNHPEHQETVKNWTSMCGILASANVDVAELMR
jgi:hypothetical protein